VADSDESRGPAGMYLPGWAGATTLLWLGLLAGAAGAGAPAGALMDLRGEVPGIGEVKLSWLYGQPLSVVLLERGQADAATPVGNALNSVMVAQGGRRVSVLALQEVPAATRPVARRLIGVYRDRVLEKVRAEYTSAGKTAPLDLDRTAWLVADWTGAWKPLLAPECAGLAVAYLDAGLRRVDVHCDPTPEQAAARSEALLRTGR
jgi:hypothetical protein